MKIGIGQLICLAFGVFLISLGAGLMGGRMTVQRHVASFHGMPKEVAQESEPSPRTPPVERPVQEIDRTLQPQETPPVLPAVSEKKKQVTPPKDMPTPTATASKQAPKAAETKDPAIAIKEGHGKNSSNYTVQVLSTQNLDDARDAERRIMAGGFPARVSVADLGDKGKWYRVYVGFYQREEEAAAVLKNVGQIPGFQKSFLKPLEPEDVLVEPFGRKESSQ